MRVLKFIWALVNARFRTLFTLQFRYRYKPRMTGKEVKLSAIKRPSYRQSTVRYARLTRNYYQVTLPLATVLWLEPPVIRHRVQRVQRSNQRLCA
jgi:hypothetical protein